MHFLTGAGGGWLWGWDAMHIPQIACQSNQCWYDFHHILPHSFGVSNSRGCRACLAVKDELEKGLRAV